MAIALTGQERKPWHSVGGGWNYGANGIRTTFPVAWSQHHEEADGVHVMLLSLATH